MKKIFYLFIIFALIGIGTWVGYKNGTLKAPIDSFFGKISPAPSVTIDPDQAETVLKIDPKIDPKIETKIEPTKNPSKNPPEETIKPKYEPTHPKNVLPGDVAEAKKLLASAIRLAEKADYKEARELLKKSRTLRIEDDLLQSCETLYNKYRDFDRLTRFVEPIERREDGGIDLIELENGNILEGIILKKTGNQLHFLQVSSNIKSTFSADTITSSRSLSAQDAKTHFLKQYEKKKREAKLSDPQKVYDLVEYACQYQLLPELHEFFESSYKKESDSLLSVAEIAAKKNYRQYVWSKMKGERDEAQKYLKRVLTAFNDTQTAQLALEDEEEEKNPQKKQAKIQEIVKETKATPTPPVSTSTSQSDLTQKADQFYQKGMEYARKAQPGMPQSDENLAKAKAEFEKSVQLYDTAITRAEERGESTVGLENKIQQASEMLYFCVKQTRVH